MVIDKLDRYVNQFVPIIIVQFGGIDCLPLQFVLSDELIAPALLVLGKFGRLVALEIEFINQPFLLLAIDSDGEEDIAILISIPENSSPRVQAKIPVFLPTGFHFHRKAWQAVRDLLRPMFRLGHRVVFDKLSYLLIFLIIFMITFPSVVLKYFDVLGVEKVHEY